MLFRDCESGVLCKISVPVPDNHDFVGVVCVEEETERPDNVVEPVDEFSGIIEEVDTFDHESETHVSSPEYEEIVSESGGTSTGECASTSDVLNIGRPRRRAAEVARTLSSLYGNFYF